MNIRKIDGHTVFDLSSADLSQIAETLVALEATLREENVQRVIANLQGIQSIYSMQIGTLVAMHVKCYENLAVMSLANVHPHVRNQLEMVGLDKLMELHHGLEAARGFNAKAV
jgi:anti-anti-sigma factor